jgi:CSLREA domain-containing protein
VSARPRFIVTGALFLVLLLSSRARAFTVTFVVNSPADTIDANVGDAICQTATPGVCTLRAAVQEAGVGLTGINYVIQVPAYTITLVLGNLDVTHSMQIVGAGMRATVISGGNSSRVFGIENHSGIVALSDMTLRDGNAGDPQQGGAIEVYGGAVSLTRCLLVHNYAYLGGAIALSGSGISLATSQCVMTDCHATLYGGALNDSYGSSITLTSTTINGNTAALSGGGVFAQAFNQPGTKLNLVNCTVTGNTGDSGGGIYVDGGVPLGLFNVTVAGNRANGGTGGGIARTTAGTGVFATFINSILAYNEYRVKTEFFPDDCAGTFTSDGHSTVRTVLAGHCTVTGAYSTADPMLGVLQDNGGFTPTQALLSGSPAIEGGNSQGCVSDGGGPLTTDQRGVHRPIGAVCDRGAYERAPCGDVNGDGAVDVLDVFFLINYLFAGGPLPPGLSNVNGDSARDVLDVFFLINGLFANGPAPSCPGT